jgi:polyisoprenoid-binding protein YceI
MLSSDLRKDKQIEAKGERKMAWVLDKAHSSIGFAVKHMMISTARGKFNDFTGSFNLNEQDLQHSYVEGTVNVASVDTGDANRDGHLKSPDFFDVEKYPTMTFRSTKVESKGGGRFHVTGDMTIKGVTRQVTFDGTEEGKGTNPFTKAQSWAFSAELTVNRKDFGLGWNVALETGGWLVGENVKISMDLEIASVPEAAPVAA